jgi:hypothetical protein
VSNLARLPGYSPALRVELWGKGPAYPDRRLQLLFLFISVKEPDLPYPRNPKP